MEVKQKKRRKRKHKLPIKHWSHSSLMAFLRNPLAWYKRYVEEVYDQPSSPSAIIGRAGHLALEYFYKGTPKEEAIARGLAYVKNTADFDINFGKVKGVRARRKKRLDMERVYLQAIGHYLEKPPKHKVLGVEIAGVVEVDGLPIPIKAISDLVVESAVEKGAVDVVDHKFVDSYSARGAFKTLFVIQAIFNYYTVRALFGKPVRRFIVYECKKSKNKDGSPQLRKYVIDFKDVEEEFRTFHRLIHDATAELARRKVFLPNPSDLFEGDHSFDIYRLNLVEDGSAIE